MFSRRLCCHLSMFLLLASIVAAQEGGPPMAPSAANQVSAALDRLDAWLGAEANGDRWRAYLQTQELRKEIEKGVNADPAIVARALQRFSGGARGLELGPFETVRQALRVWLAELRLRYGEDFAKLAWTARGDHTPITPAQLAQARADLRQKAASLASWLGGDSIRARRWKRYLRWELLEPHLTGDVEVTRGSLAELDLVLNRFRANHPGLEMPRFLETAKALARYRALASWAGVGPTRDLRANYERLLTSIGAELQRHLERPTTETAWKIGRVLGVIDVLGHSKDFVDTVRRRFAQPNARAQVSVNFIHRMPDRPINQIRPVRDCILGTNIFGTAHTLGRVDYGLVPAENSIELAIHLTGEAHSRTNGYNGPVRINSTGRTTYSASKQISFTDEGFEASPAVADADTRTRIRSINKTGGAFGRRLVEKIAWRRAMEQKRLAENISSQHTEQRVIREFNEFVARDLADLRQRYEQRIRHPLTRQAMSPEYLRMYSKPDGIIVESTFAGRNQLAAYSPPPRPEQGPDLIVQVHESAINNYLTLAFARVKISQASAEDPPRLEGDVPNWIKLLQFARPKLAAAAATGVEIVEEAQKTIEQAVEGQDDEVQEPSLPPFRPYSITLNAEAPVGVHLDDGKLIVRVRAASLVSEDAEYSNWDFIVTYQLATRGQRILLQRVGDIEVFPTGFDPAWDKQLTAQQSGFRSTLAKNMNNRAKAGQSFPNEIPIEPIYLSRFGTLLLEQLEANDGWLTVSWLLPPPGARGEPPAPPRPAGIPPRSG